MAGSQSLVRDLLAEVHDALIDDRSGTPLQGLPALAGIDPDHFGIALATTDGQVYEVGDTNVPFCIQSISKAFTYGMALADRGTEAVDAKIDMEPSGEAFNEISLDPRTKRPRNAMVNAGAIAASSLVAGDDPGEQYRRIRETYSAYAGRELDLNEEVFADEVAAGHRNRAISHMLKEFGILEGEPHDAIDVYLRQCSLNVTCRDLAVMGATLANLGTNPCSGAQVLPVALTERVLSVMSTCGMYDAAGEWVATVGMAAKSGVGGGIVAVLPGQLALAVFSPRLDEHGNSARGVAACRRLSKRLELHALHVTRASRNAIRESYDLLEAPSVLQRPEADRRVLEEHGRSARIYELHGDLLFAGAESVVREMCTAGRDLEFLALDVRSIDDVAEVSSELLVGMRSMLRGWGCEPVVIDHAARTLPEPPSAAAEPPSHVFHSQREAILWIEEQLLERHGEGRVPEGDFVFEDHPMFERFAGRLAGALRERMEERTYADGETIVEQGDDESGVFIVMSGRVRQAIVRAGGEPRSIATLTPGACFGDVYLVTDQPHPVSVVAEGDVRLLTLPRATYAAVKDEDPELHAALLEMFMHAIHDEMARMLAAIAGGRVAPVTAS